MSTAQYPLKRRLGGPHRSSGQCSGEEKIVLHMLTTEPEFPGRPTINMVVIQTKLSRFINTKTEGQPQANK